MSRLSFTVPVIWPAVEDPSAAFGVAKLGVLNALNASILKLRFFSLNNLNLRCTEISQFLVLGPYNTDRAEFPYVFGAGTWNACVHSVLAGQSTASKKRTGLP